MIITWRGRGDTFMEFSVGFSDKRKRIVPMQSLLFRRYTIKAFSFETDAYLRLVPVSVPRPASPITSRPPVWLVLDACRNRPRSMQQRCISLQRHLLFNLPAAGVSSRSQPGPLIDSDCVRLLLSSHRLYGAAFAPPTTRLCSRSYEE